MMLRAKLKNLIMQQETQMISVRLSFLLVHMLYLKQGRAVAVAPEDGGFVVGCKDGTMRIFDENLK